MMKIPGWANPTPILNAAKRGYQGTKAIKVPHITCIIIAAKKVFFRPILTKKFFQISTIKLNVLRLLIGQGSENN